MSVQKLDYPGANLLMEADNQVTSTWRLHACEKEPWTVRFIESAAENNPRAVFIDVGANVGPYTLVAAAHGLRVLAIEPGYASYERLCHNLALNNLLGRVLTVQCLCGPGNGWEWLHYADLRPGSANHHIGGPRKRGFHMQAVEVRTLDSLLESARKVGGFDGPTYMKIDTDGGESGVLAGAEQLLRDERLRGIMIELQVKHEQQFVDYLGERGLKPWARYDERGGVNIGDICYREFVR